MRRAAVALVGEAGSDESSYAALWYWTAVINFLEDQS